MCEAIGAVHNGAAKQYQIPRETLRRYILKNKVHNATKKKAMEHNSCLGKHNEESLVILILKIESLGFGFTLSQIRRMAYEFAESNAIVYTFNKTTKMAGETWFSKFMKRHPQLSLRKPEKLSRQRAMGCNLLQVVDIYDMRKYTEHQGCAYNQNETGFTTDY